MAMDTEAFLNSVDRRTLQRYRDAHRRYVAAKDHMADVVYRGYSHAVLASSAGMGNDDAQGTGTPWLFQFTVPPEYAPPEYLAPLVANLPGIQPIDDCGGYCLMPGRGSLLAVVNSSLLELRDLVVKLCESERNAIMFPAEREFAAFTQNTLDATNVQAFLLDQSVADADDVLSRSGSIATIAGTDQPSRRRPANRGVRSAALEAAWEVIAAVEDSPTRQTATGQGGSETRKAAPDSLRRRRLLRAVSTTSFLNKKSTGQEG
eukprot:TRINITY_DN19552_c0_g1_i1.p1 TRINITY_DN19552_c0_g1~~TRINITY_DN19552_c0_g1_i1.p1  ORF type:complete len:262 (+),score=36.25 TRINITY_DN19552_c0_g1_i1:163-948(+)